MYAHRSGKVMYVVGVVRVHVEILESTSAHVIVVMNAQVTSNDFSPSRIRIALTSTHSKAFSNLSQPVPSLT